MKNFFDWYKERIQKNDATFDWIAREFKKRGYKAYGVKNGFKAFVKIVGKGKQITVEFHEAPYGWRLYYDIPPSINTGSSISIKDIHTQEFPYSIDEIESLMQPLPHKNYETKYEFYLKEL